MYPNSTKRTKTSVWGPMGWIGRVRLEKFRRDFMARTFALVLHRVSYGNQTVPNAPKWYEMHQNISLGSIGLDRVRSLRKIPTRLRGTNFCTSSARFPPSFVGQPNSPEYTQMVRNAPKHQFRVKWGGSSTFVVKNSDANSWHELFALVRPVIHRVSYGNQTVLDAPKWYEMHGNVSLGQMGWIGCIH